LGGGGLLVIDLGAILISGEMIMRSPNPRRGERVPGLAAGTDPCHGHMI
jgi:hypothetical protein